MDQRKIRHGIPMTEEEFESWQQCFILIAECIEALYNENQGGGK